MSRFNNAAPTNKTTNYAGGNAYQQDPKTELASVLLTSFVQNQYYRTADETIDRVKELMGTVDPLFAAKAALYGRTQFGMRSISHVVAGEIASRVHGEEWTKRFFSKVVYRPDDMLEILSYYYGLGKKTEPNALKKGFATALGRFKEYQLAKHRGEGKDVSLVDIVNLVHPKHTPAIAKLVAGTLKNVDTWEAKLTEAGKKAKTEDEKDKLKADAWAELLREGKLGYFALLRNLRNIITQAPELVDLATAQLTNPEVIHRSLVLPFRFFTAYQEIAEVNGVEARKVLKALEQALDISVSNMPKFEGRSLVVADHSGSMDSMMSDNSKASMFQIAALFGVALAKSANADFMYFGDIAKYYNVTGDSVLGQMRWLQQCNGGGGWGRVYGTHEVGHGTNFSAIFQEANQKYDRIFIFSDMQSWMGDTQNGLRDLEQRFGTRPTLYAFDLGGYGQSQFPADRVYQMAGFSEKIFDVVKLLDTDRNALVKEIEKVEV